MQPCSEPPTQLCEHDMQLYFSGPAPRADVWMEGRSPFAYQCAGSGTVVVMPVLEGSPTGG